MPKTRIVNRQLQDPAVITYCDFSDPDRKTEIGRHKTLSTAMRQYARLWQVYGRSLRHKVWQEVPPAPVEPERIGSLGSRFTYERGDTVLTPLGIGTIQTTPDEQGCCKVMLKDSGTIRSVKDRLITCTTFQFTKIIKKWNDPLNAPA